MLSVAVMAHPKRADMVDELVASLDREPTVVWDEINDRHDTGARAMEAFNPDASHHLVIQDDTIAAPDLIAGAEKALTFVPDGHPLSLYLGRVRPFREAVNRTVAQADGASFVAMKGIYWGPAVILPTADIEAMLAWYRGPQGRKVSNYDRRMSRWYEKRRLQCWYSWPSLVDHRGHESLVMGRKGTRTAHRFVEGSALGVDWSGPCVNLRGGAQLDRERQRLARV